VTVTASARPDRPQGLPAALRAAVALAVVLTVITVGLAGLFATAASAQTLRRPETRVAAFGLGGSQIVGDHEPVLAGQRRARAPTYDQLTVGSCVAAEDQPTLQGCGFSFTAGTPVLLADGTSKAISQLTTNDKVLATNTTTGKNHAEPVLAVMVNHDTDLFDLTIQSGGVTSVIHTTSNHLFWDQSTHTWTRAAQLHRGDQLQTPNHATASVVTGATSAVTSGAMWDLTINTDHDFFIDTIAAPVLVHNCPTSANPDNPGVDRGPDDPGLPKARAFFATKADALQAALTDNGVTDPDLVEETPVYGQNPNMLGPNGEPWTRITAINDDGDLVEIQEHPAHFFEDNATQFGPHYKGPDGFHYFWYNE